MKQQLMTIILAAITLCAAATDRFYIEDFTIKAGETVTVNILLDNEKSYTGFQSDLYLPDGLTVEQEDGEYIFDLTSRKGKDHTLSSQLQANGAIRLLSYSLNIKTYSGTSGALVTFNVTAAEDFTGPATIELKNSLFVIADGTEYALPDESCTVSNGSSTDTHEIGDVNHDGKVNVDDVAALIGKILGNGEGCETCADVNGDGKVNVDDVAALIGKILGN